MKERFVAISCALCLALACTLCGCHTAPDTDASVPSSQPSFAQTAQAAFENFLTASALPYDQYTFFDLTGDKVPELLCAEQFTLSAYIYRNQAVEPLLVAQHNNVSGAVEVLENGALLFKHMSDGVAYRYQTFAADGSSKMLCFDMMESNGDNGYRFDGRQLSRDEWLSLAQPYLDIPEAVTQWHSYLQLRYDGAKKAFTDAPDQHRDVGALQSETQQMVLLEGKYYQSYVSSTADIRYIFIAAAEYPEQGVTWLWDWVAVGTAQDYSLDKIGTVDEGYK